MALKTINFTDKNLQMLQDNVDAAITPIQRAPLTGGVLLSNISLTSGQDNLVEHTLGRRPQIVIPGVPTANSTIWSPTTASLGNQNSNTQYINLRCSTSCTVSVWVSL